MRGQEAALHILRFKEGSIPTVASEYKKLKETDRNYTEITVKDGNIWNDFVMKVYWRSKRLTAQYNMMRTTA